MRRSTHLQQMEAHERDSIFTRHVYMRMCVLFRSVRQHKLCNFWIPFISPSIAGWVLLYDEKTAGRLTSAFSRWVMRFCAQIIARYPANIISIAPLRDSKTQPVNGKDRKKKCRPGLSRLHVCSYRVMFRSLMDSIREGRCARELHSYYIEQQRRQSVGFVNNALSTFLENQYVISYIVPICWKVKGMLHVGDNPCRLIDGPVGIFTNIHFH